MCIRDSYQTLYKKGLVSADDYENALLTYRQAKEQVASAKENVQKAQTLSLIHIYSTRTI